MTKRSNVYSARRSKRPRRKNPVSVASAVALALILIAAGILYAFDNSRTELTAIADTEALRTVIIPDETAEIKKDYTGFMVSFNPEKHQPNYVVWELTADEASAGGARNSKFRPDPDVYGCATLADYRNSGFDRGHMAPAADMKWSEEAMNDSHFLTNMCPQERKLNGGRWATLENKCREWAARDSALIIVCGPVLSDRMPRTIGASRIPVPERFFKVILAPYANPPRGIAFIMPNSPQVDGLRQLATSIDNVEVITGFDFFSALPDTIENMVESTAKYNDWERSRR